jgi:DNA-binding NarL/FixJ family response regulator
LIGVCGGDDDQDSLPGSRFHLPPPAPRCGERLLQKAARGIGVSIVAGRAVLTRAHTVETHRWRIMEKMDLHGIAELALSAVRRGLVS